MKVLKGKQKSQNDPGKLRKQRNGLLAKIHLGKKQLGILDEDYRALLRDFYNVDSAKDLEIEQLADLVKHFEAVGWKAKHTKESKKKQLQALRLRAENLSREIPNGSRRLKGLTLKICGVSSLEWADASSLKRLLAVLERIKREEGGEEN